MGAFLKTGFILLAGLLVVPAQAEFDPMAPPRIRDAEAEPLPTLAWVRLDGKNAIAWYGNTTVRLGERVEGGRVVAIREDHIVIAGRDGRRIVPMLGSAVLHQAVTLPRLPKRK